MGVQNHTCHSRIKGNNVTYEIVILQGGDDRSWEPDNGLGYWFSGSWLLMNGETAMVEDAIHSSIMKKSFLD